MTKASKKLLVRTGEVKDFFARAKAATHKADRSYKLEKTITISFEEQASKVLCLI
jgi:hypothetical protein